MFYITIENYETYNRGECIFNASVCIVQICLDQRVFPLDLFLLESSLLVAITYRCTVYVMLCGQFKL